MPRISSFHALIKCQHFPFTHSSNQMAEGRKHDELDSNGSTLRPQGFPFKTKAETIQNISRLDVTGKQLAMYRYICDLKV